jgi:zinc/manganese transport system ATP-binding protein
MIARNRPIAIVLQHQTPAVSGPPLLSLRDLTLGHDRHPAVHHLSLDIAAGQHVAVVGPNGAGKSTLLLALAGRLAPMGGRLVAPPPDTVGWLSQHTEVDPSFPVTVAEFVMLGRWHRLGPWRRPRDTDRAAVHDALHAVGLDGFAARPIGTLSGGQWQRARFARLIAQDARLILLDEPFAAIDTRTTDELLALMHRWHAEGRTVIAVLHDHEQVRRHFETTLLLARHRAVFGPTREVLTDAHWRDALQLREAFDDHAPLCDAAPAA